jgi:hypothetical protein
MRVIGVGFGRTGTASLKLALERLDLGPCYHMTSVLERPERAGEWLAVARGESSDWDGIFAGFQSTVDWPAAAFWRELIAAYPGAKVILTVRDPERWYDSMEKTILEVWKRAGSLRDSRIGPLLNLAQPGFGRFLAMNREVIVERVFGGRMDRADAVAAFRRHADEVRSTVPADRLLVFEVAEGWGPLCAFLGVTVPDEPFPHVNDAAEFNRRRAEQMRQTMLRLAAGAGVVVTAVAAGVVAARRLLARRPRA